MASIHVMNRNVTINASSAISVLNNLLRQGVAISHLCGGKAVCGTCRIKVVEGLRYFSPMREREREKLNAVYADKIKPDGIKPDGKLPEHIRLACQSYVYGDVKIHILAPGGGDKKNNEEYRKNRIRKER